MDCVCFLCEYIYIFCLFVSDACFSESFAFVIQGGYILLTTPSGAVKPKGILKAVSTFNRRKVLAVVNDPKFGMLDIVSISLEPSGARKRVFHNVLHMYFHCWRHCLCWYLPLQWMMWFALVLYQMKSYTQGNCPMTGSTEGKMIMFGVSECTLCVPSFYGTIWSLGCIKNVPCPPHRSQWSLTPFMNLDSMSWSMAPI